MKIFSWLIVSFLTLYSGGSMASHTDAHTIHLAKIEILKDKVYSHVSGDGVVNTARSRRISQATVKVIATGQYCFNNIPIIVRGGQVTVDPTVTKVARISSLSLNHPGCQALVVIGCSDKPAASAFFVKFY